MILIKLKIVLILTCFLFLFCMSSVYAFEDNSTDVLMIGNESGFDDELSSNGGNNLPVDTFLNSSDLVKYYGGNQCFSVSLLDCDGNALSNKNIN